MSIPPFTNWEKWALLSAYMYSLLLALPTPSKKNQNKNNKTPKTNKKQQKNFNMEY